MDYGRLNRKELQVLCKEHGIPANKTNAYMAEALAALLNAPKTEPISEDPAEIVKSKANLKRAGKSKKVVDVLEACEVDDLSSQLEESTLVDDSKQDMVEETCGEDIHEAVVESMIEVPSELPPQSEVVAEATKVPRKGRTTKTKPVSSVYDAAPALVEPTLEVVLPLESTIDSNAFDAADSAAPGSRLPFTYSRRLIEVCVEEQNDVGTLDLSSASAADVLPAQEDTAPRESLSQVADVMDEEVTVAAKSKKSKAKGKKVKAKPVSPITVQILDDATADVTTVTALHMPDSPTLGLKSDEVTTMDIHRNVSVSPAPGDDAFEFHTVPESFAEIMTPAKPMPIVLAMPGDVERCLHRPGRNGRACKSCASERKVASLMQDVLQAIDVHALEPVSEVALTTPVQENADKENAKKNIDLTSFSIRKLQKEVRKRGLSKRSNKSVEA